VSDFKTLKGLFIKHVSSDPSDPIIGEFWYNTTTQTLKAAPQIAAWSSGGNLSTARVQGYGAGSQTAGLAFGGEASPGVHDGTEEYDGSSWTAGGDIPSGIKDHGGFGTLTAGVLATGSNGGYNAEAFHYDGSSWTAGGNNNTARGNVGATGTQTAGIIWGGYASDSNQSLLETYDGSTWTESTNHPTAKSNYYGAGTTTATLSSGGGPPYVNTTHEYDGSSWTSGGAMNTSRADGRGGGIQTAALVAGGYNPSHTLNVESYNGSSWTEGPNISTSHTGGFAGQNSAPSAKCWVAGGNPSTTATEEYNDVATVRSVDTT